MGRVLQPGELRALCQLIFGGQGDDWRDRAREALGVSKRNLDYWLSEEGYAPPEGVYDDLMGIAGRKLCDRAERERMWVQYGRRMEELRLLNVALNQGPQRGEPVADTIHEAD